ncbi:MAG: alpha/beta fold hydrolase [Gammaproteobacteria bacterium]
MTNPPRFARSRLHLPGRGITLSIIDFGGQGPLALLAHATGFCAALWEPVAVRLRERFHVLAYDARGHGDSDKPADEHAYGWSGFAEDYAAVARALATSAAVERVAVAIGSSIGGTSALAAAARDPRLFGAVVALDPVVIPERPSGTQPTRSALEDGALRRRNVFESRAAIRAKWRERGRFADWDPRALDLYLEHGFADRADGQVELKCPNVIEAAIYRRGVEFSIWAQIGHLRTPARIVVAARQREMPAEIVESLAARSAAAELAHMDGTHLLPMVMPDRVADDILDFTARAGF